MDSLPSDTWFYIISCLYDNNTYYPLELTFLKLVSKDFHQFIIFYFKNYSYANKLKLISNYYDFMISNKYYRLFDELKGHPILFDEGLKILSSISNNLECIRYFSNNPLITYKLNATHTKLLIFEFHKSIISYVLYETTNKDVEIFLTEKKKKLDINTSENEQQLSEMIIDILFAKETQHVLNRFHNSAFVSTVEDLRH